MAFAAAAGLALGAVAVPVLAGPVTSAAAASSYYISSDYDDAYVNDCGVNCNITLGDANPYFALVGHTGKWYELEHNGHCLNIVGSTAGFYVNEESCTGRASELWWLPNLTQEDTQIISDYGTTAFAHDACLWNPEPDILSTGAQIRVEKCVSSQPTRQTWGLF